MFSSREALTLLMLFCRVCVDEHIWKREKLPRISFMLSFGMFWSSRLAFGFFMLLTD